MAPNHDFPETYERFVAPVRAKCRRILGPTAAADDVVQETFTRLWLSGPRVDAHSNTRSIMAWLYVTSTRLSIDALRERRRMHHAATEVDATACSASPADVVAARSSIVALAKSVPNDELEVALLARVDGLSHERVADILGLSERTVRRMLERFDAHSAPLREGALR